MENLSNFLGQFGISANEANKVQEIREQLFTVYDLPNDTPSPEELGLLPGTEVEENPGKKVYNSNGKFLGQVLGTYKSIQPVAFFDHIVKEIEKAGATNVNLDKMQYTTARNESIINFKIPTETVRFNNRNGKPEEIKMFLNFETGFGGTASSELGLYSKRLICSNGMKIIEAADLIKCKHTERMNATLFAWASKVSMKLAQVERIGNIWQNMDKITVTEKERQEFIFKLAGIQKGETLESQSTRKQNIVTSMQEATETEFQYAGNSLFALLQGATRYTNHNHSKGSEDFVQYGTGATINQKAEKLALQMLQTA